MPVSNLSHFAHSGVPTKNKVTNYWFAPSFGQQVVKLLSRLLRIGQINKPALRLLYAGNWIAAGDELGGHVFAVSHIPEAAEAIDAPIFRNHPHLSLLVAGGNDGRFIVGNITGERGAVMFCEHVPFTSCGQFQELSGRDNLYAAKSFHDPTLG